jgi:hypothetical protein
MKKIVTGIVTTALVLGTAVPVLAIDDPCVPQDAVDAWTEVVTPEVLEWEFVHVNADVNGQEPRWEAADWNGESYDTSWVKTGESRVKTEAVVVEHEAVDAVVCDNDTDEEEPTQEEPVPETTKPISTEAILAAPDTGVGF